MHTLQTIWRGLDWSYLLDIALSVLPALICITLHECAHGWAAYRLGDDTAKRMGRLTLDPLKHIDIIGLAMMVLFRFGWAKPQSAKTNSFSNTQPVARESGSSPDRSLSTMSASRAIMP